MAALIDTHLHLYRPEFDGEADAVRARARAAGVGAWIHIGYDAETIPLAQEYAAQDATGWATAGVHPHDAASYDEAIEAEMRRLATEGRLLAIGECGLDYYRDLSPRDLQHVAFRRQIALAAEVELPMIFHVRDAYDDARAILEEEGLPPRRGIFHAFAGDAAFANWAVDAGFKLGIGGVLTYRNAHLPEAIHGLPAEALLLETDAPWLPPQPWRGRRNEPAYVRHTAEVLAERLGRDLDEVSDVWAGEVESLFGIDLGEELWAMRPSQYPAPEQGRGRK
jgi:TatD DNase family protein